MKRKCVLDGGREEKWKRIYDGKILYSCGIFGVANGCKKMKKNVHIIKW